MVSRVREFVWVGELVFVVVRLLSVMMVWLRWFYFCFMLMIYFCVNVKGCKELMLG